MISGAMFAIVVASVLSALSLRGLSATDRLPVPERLWFHAVATWPIVVKASLGSVVFATALADRSLNYPLIVYGPALVGGVLLFARRILQRGARLFGPGLLAAGAIVLAFPRVIFAGEQLVPTFIALGVLLPQVLRSDRVLTVDMWRRSARWAIFLVISSVLATAVISPTLIIGECRLDKCSVFGQTLISPITNNGNFLGVAVAILLPLALPTGRAFQTAATAASSLVIIEVSGSRAALTAACFVLVVLVVAWLTRRATLVTSLGFALAAVASIVTATVPFPYDFATYRGLLWTRARELLEGHLTLGRGPSYWTNNEQLVSVFPNYSPHNQWLELAVSGGIVMVALVAACLVWAVRVVPPDDRPYVALALAAVLAVGVLEAPFSPAKLGLAPFALLLPLAIAGGSDHVRPVVPAMARLQPHDSAQQQDATVPARRRPGAHRPSRCFGLRR